MGQQRGGGGYGQQAPARQQQSKVKLCFMLEYDLGWGSGVAPARAQGCLSVVLASAFFFVSTFAD